jgi:hypothetical protein
VRMLDRWEGASLLGVPQEESDRLQEVYERAQRAIARAAESRQQLPAAGRVRRTRRMRGVEAVSGSPTSSPETSSGAPDRVVQPDAPPSVLDGAAPLPQPQPQSPGGTRRALSEARPGSATLGI